MVDSGKIRSLLLIASLVAAVTGCRSAGNDGSDSYFNNLFNLGGRNVTNQPSGKSSQKVSNKQKADVQMVIARSLDRQGDVARAKQVYMSVLHKDPDRADAHHRLAVLHDMTGTHEESIKHYHDALLLDPQNAEIHCDLGYSLYLQQKWPDAETSLRHALELKPELARAHNNLGLLLARTARPDEALMHFSRVGSSEA